MTPRYPEAVCRSCAAPVIWATTSTGKRNAAVALGWAGRPPMRAYLCPHCGWWHIGKPDRQHDQTGADA